MARPHRITLERTYAPGDAAIIHRSLAPESADLVDERSETSVTVSDGLVRIEIIAADLVALRAAANTWLGLLSAAEASLAVADAGF